MSPVPTIDTSPRRVVRRRPAIATGQPGDIRRRDYERGRDLARLLALWPDEMACRSRLEHRRLLARLETALRRERQRGIGGHWSYDLARHAQLLAAYGAEKALYETRHGRYARQVTPKRP